MKTHEIYIPREWISQFKQLTMFGLLSLACIFLSWKFPWTIVTGDLFSIGGYHVTLSLPILFLLLPCVVLSRMILRIYDVRYSIDPRGVQAQIGIVSMNQRVIRVRYEDIRTVEVSQSVMDRLLNIGRVDISTAASTGVEIYFSGIKAPLEFQNWVQAESDGRQKNIVVKNGIASGMESKGGE